MPALPARAAEAGLPTTTANPAAAIAVIDAGLCTAWRGLPCRTCREVCPEPDAITLERRGRSLVPVAGTGACTGCGLCQAHCPAKGAIRLRLSDDAADKRVRIVATGSDAA